MSANGAATESNRKSFVKFYKASDNKTIRIEVENDIYVSANGQPRPQKGEPLVKVSKSVEHKIIRINLDREKHVLDNGTTMELNREITCKYFQSR